MANRCVPSTSGSPARPGQGSRRRQPRARAPGRRSHTLGTRADIDPVQPSPPSPHHAAGSCEPRAATASTPWHASKIRLRGGAPSGQRRWCAPRAGRTTKATTCRRVGMRLGCRLLCCVPCCRCERLAMDRVLRRRLGSHVGPPALPCPPASSSSSPLLRDPIPCALRASNPPHCASSPTASQSSPLLGGAGGGARHERPPPHLQLLGAGHKPRRGGQPQVRGRLAERAACLLLCCAGGGGRPHQPFLVTLWPPLQLSPAHIKRFPACLPLPTGT